MERLMPLTCLRWAHIETALFGSGAESMRTGFGVLNVIAHALRAEGRGERGPRDAVVENGVISLCRPGKLEMQWARRVAPRCGCRGRLLCAAEGGRKLANFGRRFLLSECRLLPPPSAVAFCRRSLS